ncbi:MAG: translation initiation factor IF-2 [Myxococcota bacterium]
MGKSDLIDKINARVKSELSSRNPRNPARPKSEEKDDRSGEASEQRITSTKGTVLVRRRSPKSDEPLGASPSGQGFDGGAEVVETAPARVTPPPAPPVLPPVVARAPEPPKPEPVVERAPEPPKPEPVVEKPAREVVAEAPRVEPSAPPVTPPPARVEPVTPPARVVESAPVATPTSNPNEARVISMPPQRPAQPARAPHSQPRSQQAGGRQDHAGHRSEGGGHRDNQGGHRSEGGGHRDNQGGHRSEGGGHRDNQGGYRSEQGGYRSEGGGYRNDQGNRSGYGNRQEQGARPPHSGGGNAGVSGEQGQRFDRGGQRQGDFGGGSGYRGQQGGQGGQGGASQSQPPRREPYPPRQGRASDAPAPEVQNTRSRPPAPPPAPSGSVEEAPRSSGRSPETRSIEDVLAEERGHVPMQRRAVIVRDSRPPVRPPQPPRVERVEVAPAPVVLAGEEVLEGVVEAGEGAEGAAARNNQQRRAPALTVTTVKEIANEDRRKEKASTRSATAPRGVPGRSAAEEEAFRASKGVKKPVAKKKEVVQRRDVSGEGDTQFRKARKVGGKKEKEKDRDKIQERNKPKITVPKAAKRVIRIEDTITVADLSHRMGVKAPAVITKLIKLGVMATINQPIDHDTASLIAADFGYEVENVAFDEGTFLDATDTPEELIHRPPVVTIMGHVDHGKTTLLDAIRDTDVAGKEAGGITQHIGAYKVHLEDGREVVFLDTPGHEAFTSMRARGAQVTDVVVLVVAADDGVMPQTLEALNHAKAAKVPVMVAVNKIDKPGANPDRIMQKLAEHELVPEEWGGTTIYAKVSAKQRLGIKELLELILLQAEVLELKANPNRQARATVIESKLDRGRGPVATVLVNAGTLRIGDVVVVGSRFGKVRAMLDDKGKQVKEAGPASPVEILGLSDVPEAGDTLAVLDDLDMAREIAEKRASKVREQNMARNARVTLEELFSQMQKSETKELKLVLKVDVQGSLEALAKAIRDLSTDAVKTTVLHSGVGNISEGDVMLASASNAIVIGFNVKPDNNASSVAEQNGVEIKTYSVIYDALDELRRAMVGMLRPVQQERVVGHATVKAIFSIPKVGNIAGCIVTDGKIHRNSKIRLMRSGKLHWEGGLGSLRRGKDDVREVLQGFECGIALDGFHDYQEGDVIEAFAMDEIAPTL